MCIRDSSELVSSDQFKSYDDLKKRLNYVLGLGAAKTRQDPETVAEEELPPRPEEQVAAAVSGSDADEEDALSYFSKLAEG